MPDPLVVRVLADYRRQLQDVESAQFRDMASRWAAVQDRLTVQIDSLAAEIDALRQAGEVVSRGRLLRLDRYQALLTQVDAEITRFDRLTTGQIVSAQSDAIGLGLEAAAAAIDAGYQQAGRVAVDWNRLPRRAVTTMAGLASDGSPLAALIAQSYPLTVQALTDTLVQAVGLGWSPKKTAAAMRQAADLPLNRALRIARTEQLRAYREATREQYAESGVVTAYRRLAAKSLRTCPACLFADGKIYQLDEPLDEHVAGRCQLIPIIDGVPERRWQTGREWFGTLPAEQQAQILGPAAHEKWKREGFDLGAFVTRRENATWGNSLQVTPLGGLGKRKSLFPAPEFGPEQKTRSQISRPKTGADVRALVSTVDQQTRQEIAAAEARAMQANDDFQAAMDRRIAWRQQNSADRSAWMPEQEAQYQALRLESEKLSAQAMAENKKLSELQAARAGRMRQMLYVDNPVQINVELRTRNAGSRKTWQAGIDEFSRMVGVDLPTSQPIPVVSTRRSRSFFSPDANSLNMSAKAPTSVVIHEMGHALERNNPEVLRRALEFYDRRTQGESLMWLGPGYDRRERARRDQFVDAYMGKEYADRNGTRYGTEIVSMGMQRMWEDPAAFAQKDPDYFDFIADLLRGN